MDKKIVKKSLVQSLHDRSGGGRPNCIVPHKLPQFVTMDNLEALLERVERLENEANRYNKVLNLYIDRIEDLEATVQKYENESKRSKMLINHSIIRSVPVSTRESIQPGCNSVPGKLSSWYKFTQLFKHRQSLEALKQQNIYQDEPCFDTEIENVVKHEQYSTIPKIVVECVRLIEEKAKLTPTEGLYRISGNHVEIQKIRFCIDANDYNSLRKLKDIHTVIGVLKLFLREIKNPLIKISEVNAFIGPPKQWILSPVKNKTETLKKLVRSLPESNRDTLNFFFNHLSKLSRMPLQFVNARSLAVSITPTIFHFTFNNSNDIHTTLKEGEVLTNCLEIMIEYHEKVFELNLQYSKKNNYEEDI